MWEEGEERRNKREKERKGEWNWKVVQRSSFRILEVANLAGRLAFANSMTGSKELQFPDLRKRVQIFTL